MSLPASLMALALALAVAADAARPTRRMARSSTNRAAAAATRSTPTGSARRIAASTAARRAPRPTSTTRPAVKNSTVVWGERTLDAWLTNPQALIPGQRMNFRVATGEDRAPISLLICVSSPASEGDAD